MKNKKIYFTFLMIIAFLFLNIDVDAQCAMCKAAAESSLKSNPHSMARSLNSGILYLMAVPYLLMCFIFRKQIAQIWRRIFSKTAQTPVK